MNMKATAMKQTAKRGSSAPDLTVRGMTIPQVERAYNVSRASIWRGIQSGRIKIIRPSGNPRGRAIVLLSSLEQDPQEMETA
jgi:hypothetical protein